jgi:hypothetical protein
MAFFGVMGLCIFQMILMLSFTVFFLSSESAAAHLYRQLDWLGNYAPLLLKYRDAAANAEVRFDLAVVFSSSFSFLAVQAVVIPAILVVFFKSLASGAHFYLSKQNIFFLTFALCVLISPLWNILIGPSDLRNAGAFSNRIFYGNVGTAFIEYCVLMPWFNLVFFALIFAASRNRS